MSDDWTTLGAPGAGGHSPRHDRRLRADPRRRGRRVGVGVLVVAIVALDTVGPLRDAVVEPVARASSWVASGLTPRDERIQHLEQARIRAEERARAAESGSAPTGDERSLTARHADAEHDVVIAHAIAFTPAERSGERRVELDTGQDGGVVANAAVVAGGGLVGRVTRVGAHSATVTLIDDDASVVGARDTRTGALARVTGRAPAGVGARPEGHLSLVLPAGARVQADDVVETAGSPGGAPYPAGVPIGWVTSVDADGGRLERSATVRPFVDATRLDVVGILRPRVTR